MVKRAEYRNAIRSRMLIREAFVELMTQKHINKITVTDIAKVADINRGTFYAHYDNTLDVLEEIENDLIDKILEFIGEFKYDSYVTDTKLILKKLNEYFNQDIDFYRKLISSPGSQEFLQKIKVIFIDAMMNNKKIPDDIKTSYRFKISINYFAGGIIGLYQDWFSDNLEGSLDDLVYELNLIIRATDDFFI